MRMSEETRLANGSDWSMTAHLSDVLILIGHEQEATVVQDDTVDILEREREKGLGFIQPEQMSLSCHFKLTLWFHPKSKLGVVCFHTLSFFRQPQISSLHYRKNKTIHDFKYHTTGAT